MKANLALALSLLTLSNCPSYAIVILKDDPNAAQSTQETTQQKTQDGQILGIIQAIDQFEIAAANLALLQNVSKPVHDLAEYLTKHHTENLQEISQLTKATGFKVLSSTQQSSLQKQGGEQLAQLKTLKDKAFETAYVNDMVTGHQDALKLIDTSLLKQATNPKVQAFLMATRAAVAHHLQLALKVQASE